MNPKYYITFCDGTTTFASSVSQVKELNNAKAIYVIRKKCRNRYVVDIRLEKEILCY